MPGISRYIDGLKEQRAADNAAHKKRINDPFRDVPRAQDLAREGVEAYGEIIQPYLADEIGKTLGGLNEIGALRSGGTTVALNDITRTYADRVGAFAKSASLDAIGVGQQAFLDRERRKTMVEESRTLAKNRRGDFMRDLGGVLGSGIGFWASGGFSKGGGGKGGSEGY